MARNAHQRVQGLKTETASAATHASELHCGSKGGGGRERIEATMDAPPFSQRSPGCTSLDASSLDEDDVCETDDEFAVVLKATPARRQRTRKLTGAVRKKSAPATEVHSSHASLSSSARKAHRVCSSQLTPDAAVSVEGTAARKRVSKTHPSEPSRLRSEAGSDSSPTMRAKKCARNRPLTQALVDAFADDDESIEITNVVRRFAPEDPVQCMEDDDVPLSVLKTEHTVERRLTMGKYGPQSRSRELRATPSPHARSAGMQESQSTRWSRVIPTALLPGPSGELPAWDRSTAREDKISDHNPEQDLNVSRGTGALNLHGAGGGSDVLNIVSLLGLPGETAKDIADRIGANALACTVFEWKKQGYQITGDEELRGQQAWRTMPTVSYDCSRLQNGTNDSRIASEPFDVRSLLGAPEHSAASNAKSTKYVQMSKARYFRKKKFAGRKRS
ncbi:hypothetical protein FVE85_7982 [Porphyridium purpureum]|uniref:Uncharacterized protein n=1 Tax=Porphyridium purpureum TaxID=35688 RepID=A0A5J4YMT9_PORPP|nr:hypothetical protein FVE85_7982 [Porphyridium purpureum]|eukprot:POR7223..scf295_9